jgi:hypothetical protein
MRSFKVGFARRRFLEVAFLGILERRLRWRFSPLCFFGMVHLHEVFRFDEFEID